MTVLEYVKFFFANFLFKMSFPALCWHFYVSSTCIILVTYQKKWNCFVLWHRLAIGCRLCYKSAWMSVCLFFSFCCCLEQVPNFGLTEFIWLVFHLLGLTKFFTVSVKMAGTISVPLAVFDWVRTCDLWASTNWVTTTCLYLFCISMTLFSVHHLGERWEDWK